MSSRTPLTHSQASPDLEQTDKQPDVQYKHQHAEEHEIIVNEKEVSVSYTVETEFSVS